MRRNLAQSFIEHGQITTTVPKAKTVRPYLERLITLAVTVRRRAGADDHLGALRAKRIIHKLLDDRSIIPAAHRADYNQMSDAARAKTMRMASGRRYRTGEPRGRLDFTAESVSHRLIEVVARRCEGRSGGYTRLIRLAETRVGDSAPLAILQLVGDEKAPLSITKPKKSARKRRADGRYAFAIKLSKEFASRSRQEGAAKSTAE